MDALIGYTGFVGSNLALQHKFDMLFNSRNIDEITSNEYDLVVCAGAKGVKWYANQFPEDDLNGIRKLCDKFGEIKTRRFILISTVDVYKNPVMVDEETIIEKEGLHPYGLNRFYLENRVADTFPEYNIVRLPALFGRGIKKNFIYDLITLVPSAISTSYMDLIKERAGGEELKTISESYYADEKGNYVLSKEIDNKRFERLKDILKNIGCTSLSLKQMKIYLI